MREKLTIGSRKVGDVSIFELKGTITLGEGDVVLKKAIQESLKDGDKKILLDLDKVKYMDSSGIGELVACYTSVTNRGGQLKLLNLKSRILELLQVTQLLQVFQAYDEEGEALESFSD
jgi:anti-sigma B factor antagonist